MILKKRGRIFVALILFSVLSIVFITAQTATPTPTNADLGYTCLENQLGTNCGGTESTKQAAFNLLAIAYDSSRQSNCKTALNANKQTNCWGETGTGSCTIKSTALGILALEHIQENTDNAINWLLSKKLSNTGLIWFLEIDSDNKTECTVNGAQVIVEENKKLTGAAPPGLAKAYSNYWFQINDINKNYTISCDEDFVTALIYQKPQSNIYHIPGESKSAYAHESITEEVVSYCFSTSSQCDYEGSLWASLALEKAGEEINPYLPYITSMSDDPANRKFLPASFLYILTGSSDYYSDLIGLQRIEGFWDVSGNKRYDTALASLALQNYDPPELDTARGYLIQVQRDDGCWQSDTAFILHSAWPKNPSSGGGGVTINYCEDYNYFCTGLTECPSGSVLDNFACDGSFVQECCSIQPQQRTCAEQNGVECAGQDEQCSGSIITASDTYDCCEGSCTIIDTSNECEDAGYFCERNECGDNQEEIETYNSDCEFNEVCCEDLPPSKKGINWILIVLLVILIILVILAIIYRNQLKIWWFKRKSGLKSQRQGAPPSRPQGSPLPMTGFMPRPSIRRPQRGPPQRRQSSTKDKEFADTMKKLRDMSN